MLGMYYFYIIYTNSVLMHMDLHNTHNNAPE